MKFYILLLYNLILIKIYLENFELLQVHITRKLLFIFIYYYLYLSLFTIY